MSGTTRLLRQVLLVATAAAVLLFALPGHSQNPRKAYLKDLAEWTGELKVYKGFNTALILRATYLTAPMRDVLAAERTRLLNPTPEDRAAFDTRMDEDNAAYHDIIFSAQTPLPAARRFGEADTGWVIWLEADGVQEKLVRVEHIRKPSALHLELYAHMNIWSELWIARFERTVDSPDEVVLHVGSGYGNGDVTWKNLQSRR